MKPFQYVGPRQGSSPREFIGKNGRYLGGGIDLLGEMKDYIVSPDVLVSVKNFLGSQIILWAEQPANQPISPLRQDITRPDATHPAILLIITPSVKISELAENPGIKSYLPGVAEAASEVGSPQIRNVATVAGNLLQHSRCWYYRQPDVVCQKRGGSICYAQEGENKYSALFSGSNCVSPIVSNLSVIFEALEAIVIVEGQDNSRGVEYSISKLYQEAWQNVTAHNSLKPEELVIEINVPLKRKRSAYRQISEKREFDWALVSCAAAGNVTDGKLTDARVVLGAVAPVPYMVEEANKFLEGKPLNDETASKAADIILKDAKPLAQNGYKVPLAHTLIRRTLLALNP